MYSYEFPRPAVTVDLVTLSVVDEALSVLLIERDAEPHKGKLALPGGFVHEEEALEVSALRVLDTKARLKDIYMEQLATFGDPGRDPRGHIISVAYLVVLPVDYDHEGPGQWRAVNDKPALAFDHRRILDLAVARVQRELQHAGTGLEFLPQEFTLPQVQKIYESILDEPLDKRNFRKAMLASGTIEATDRKSRGGAHPPAMIYRRSSA